MTTPAAQRPEDERLGIGPNVVYGLQHVLTMYGGMVATPLILGQIAGLTPSEIGLLIAATLFTGGLATLLQTIGLPFFGCRLPLVQGVSFAGVATMGAILTSGSGGMPAVLGAVMAASLFGLLITPIFSQIIRFFPPLVTGIVITSIGLSLLPVAVRWIMGGNSHASDFGSMANIALAAVTFLIVLILGKLGDSCDFAAVDLAGDGHRHPHRDGRGHGRLHHNRRRPAPGTTLAVLVRYAGFRSRRCSIDVHRRHGHPGGNLCRYSRGR